MDSPVTDAPAGPPMQAVAVLLCETTAINEYGAKTLVNVFDHMHFDRLGRPVTAPFHIYVKLRQEDMAARSGTRV
jgi:hypothetical protein